MVNRAGLRTKQGEKKRRRTVRDRRRLTSCLLGYRKELKDCEKILA